MPYENAATLEVNLTSIVANYQSLKSRHVKNECAAVVKADAYGLGMKAVAEALWQVDCRKFFVATLEEAIELRAALPHANIAVFQGPLNKEEGEYLAHGLTPVINDRKQLEHYQDRFQDTRAILHIDTGMTRLGLTQSELAQWVPDMPPGIAMAMSHLACANDAAHAKNAEQLARFREAIALLPGVKASLANSAGLFLGQDFHFDLARPGCALYGINPIDGDNPMQPVAMLSAPILQWRTLDRKETIGYGALYEAPQGARIAIAALGYADGVLRGLTGIGSAYVAGHKVPFAGRVSMDMIALDVSALPESAITPSARVEFINDRQTVNDVADAAGTIGYEIFTRIGRRVKRVYRS